MSRRCGKVGSYEETEGGAERQRPKKLRMMHVSRSVPLVGPLASP